MLDRDVTYTASWKINQYTISFNTDGGSEIASITQNYNTEVSFNEIPVKKDIHSQAGIKLFQM